jgi:hypothetical protein
MLDARREEPGNKVAGLNRMRKKRNYNDPPALREKFEDLTGEQVKRRRTKDESKEK